MNRNFTHRKQYATINAIQWNGDNGAEVLAFTGEGGAVFPVLGYAEFNSANARYTIQKGDWIIRDGDGDLTVLSDEDFRAHYEECH